MRWILFDIVVGAALVWLVWDARPGEPPAPADLAVAAAPAAPPEPIEQPVPKAPPADPAPALIGDPPVPASPTIDRGQRLRALARDAEALFLRGRE